MSRSDEYKRLIGQLDDMLRRGDVRRSDALLDVRLSLSKALREEGGGE